MTTTTQKEIKSVLKYLRTQMKGDASYESILKMGIEKLSVLANEQREIDYQDNPLYQRIIEMIGRDFELSTAVLMGNLRSKFITNPRQIAYYVMNAVGDFPDCHVARFMGKDHTTVRSALSDSIPYKLATGQIKQETLDKYVSRATDINRQIKKILQKTQ